MLKILLHFQFVIFTEILLTINGGKEEKRMELINAHTF